MLKIDNYTEIKREGDVYYITLPFSRDFPLLRFNFDVGNAEVEVDGKQYTVVDCLVSDNGEWINLVANRIFDEIEERQRIGQRIADLRKEKGLTQQDIADRTGIQRNHISRIEAGKYSVGFDTLQSIAEALGGRIDIITE